MQELSHEELNALLHEHLFKACWHSITWNAGLGVCAKCGTRFSGEWDDYGDNPNYITGDGMLLVIGSAQKKGFFYKSEVFENSEWGVMACFGGKCGSGSAYADDIEHLPSATAYAILKAMGVIKD